ncbi:PilZ domain-containing protein [Sphingomonadaceae bacterium OTU29MARTA1]|uniref:PilZ domain-containing protein n=1 Tax=Sphingomonas sp. Leaf37 TaxID=2876552 RepID=UPI001E3133F5|nr:PilZ domain-containing protein [Sphingomonas sp. Leaf37]USU09400.1 PilZ domain-containing protein [Sphingomonadaceae bacterium OTU29MARTA1]
MFTGATNPIDDRTEPRDEVHHRSRAMLADRRSVPVLIVNLSPQGLMIRSDAPVSVGEWLRIQLPVVGEVQVAVRWALGGRIGCQLERPIAANRYHMVLGAMSA